MLTLLLGDIGTVLMPGDWHRVQMLHALSRFLQRITLWDASGTLRATVIKFLCMQQEHGRGAWQGLLSVCSIINLAASNRAILLSCLAIGPIIPTVPQVAFTLHVENHKLAVFPPNVCVVGVSPYSCPTTL